jgi:type II secretory pathway component PulC
LSIIYEALKKVESSISKKNTAQPQQEKQPEQNKNNRLIILYIFVVALGILLGNYAFGLFSTSRTITAKNRNLIPQKTAQQINKSTLPIQKAQTQTIAPNPAPLPAPAEPSFILSGVFFEENDGYALINNRIVRLGDVINQAEVKEITLDGVKLELNGKDIDLANPSN